MYWKLDEEPFILFYGDRIKVRDLFWQGKSSPWLKRILASGVDLSHLTSDGECLLQVAARSASSDDIKCIADALPEQILQTSDFSPCSIEILIERTRSSFQRGEPEPKLMGLIRDLNLIGRLSAVQLYKRILDCYCPMLPMGEYKLFYYHVLDDRNLIAYLKVICEFLPPIDTQVEMRELIGLIQAWADPRPNYTYDVSGSVKTILAINGLFKSVRIRNISNFVQWCATVLEEDKDGDLTEVIPCLKSRESFFLVFHVVMAIFQKMDNFSKENISLLFSRATMARCGLTDVDRDRAIKYLMRYPKENSHLLMIILSHIAEMS